MWEHVVKSGETVLKGQPVTLDNTSGHLVPPGADALAAANVLVGISDGYCVGDGSLKVPVIIGSDNFWEIQALTFATELLMRQAMVLTSAYGMTAGSGAAAVSGLTHLSAIEMNPAIAGTTPGTHFINLIDWPQRPDNLVGANVKVIVSIVDDEYLDPISAASDPA